MFYACVKDSMGWTKKFCVETNRAQKAGSVESINKEPAGYIQKEKDPDASQIIRLHFCFRKEKNPSPFNSPS